MGDDPAVAVPLQSDGQPEPVAGVALELSGVPQRGRACEKATSSPALTSSETISNDAPCRCQVKDGGQVSR
jgi:hypothetical protein